MGADVPRWLTYGVALTALALPAAAHSRVAPLTPEARVMMERQSALENAVRARFGDPAFNQLRDTYGSIVVAEERQGAPGVPRVLVKDEHGWNELTRSGRRRLSRQLSTELDRHMVDGDLWRETPYAAGQPCRRPMRVFILRHWNQGDRYGRQPCGSRGLAGRVAQIAATMRIPSGPVVTTAPPETVEAPPGLPEAEYKAGRQMHARLEHSVWAWERRSLAGFVDPFADNAIVELPDRTLRGKEQIIAWARGLQRWIPDGQYIAGSRQVLHRSKWPRPQKDHALGRWEVRWGEESGRPMRRTYSATWRNNGGLWQIAHMKVSADKPVGDARIAW